MDDTDSEKNQETPEKLNDIKDSGDHKTDQAATASTEQGGEDKDTSKKAPTAKGVVQFNKKIQILTGRSLPEYDKGPAKAYAAKIKDDPAEIYFAMVCDEAVLPRSEILSKLDSLTSKSICRFIDSGVVYWPPAKQERFVVLYENSLGKPLVKQGKMSALGWKADQVIKSFIHPMVNALLDMRDFNIYHGSINLCNIYDKGVSGKIEDVALGDFLSTPPGYTQPAIFEPLERSTSDPIFRGVGRPEDDVYALGVCIAMLIRSKDPLAGKTEEEIYRARVENGTYMCLLGADTLSGPVLELLRFILHDQAKNRATLEDIMLWLDGQRLAPKQAVRQKKAARGVVIDGEAYYVPLTLSRALWDDINYSVKFIDDGDMEQWLGRALENKEMTEKFKTLSAKEQAIGRGPGYHDRILSVTSMALNPCVAMTFQGKNMTPDGFGFAFAEAMRKDDDLQPFIDAITYKMFAKWVEAQDDPLTDVSLVLARFERARLAMRQKGYGFSVERAMYFLCPEAPCMSPLLKGYHARSGGQILRAYEDILAKNPKLTPGRLVDRHVAAFLSVRDRGSIDVSLGSLNSSDINVHIIGNIRVLAAIQKRSKIGEVPNVTNWCNNVLQPVYNRLHDRDLRQDVSKKVRKLKSSGDINKILDIVDSPKLWKADTDGYIQAVREYRALKSEIFEISTGLDKPEQFSKGMGQNISAIVSGVLSVIIIIGFLLMQMTKSTL